jgi:ABC-type branched-subunit amino acid transport system ATPase component/ABC-type branched-subunit amino acid transport system permease subunit
MLTDVIIFLSLGLLVRVAGQVSLCQISFAAIGAAAFSKLAVDAGIPWLLAILIASLVAVPVGALIAIPAMRFSGLYLALATLGFGYLLQDMFYSSPLMFGFGSAGLPMPSPDLAWLHLDPATGLYYVVLVFAVAASALMVLLTHSRLGRLLRGTAESPVAMTGSGVSPRITVVIVFCVAAFVAAVGGALNGVVLSVASGANFDPFTSLVYLAVVLIVVGSEPWYALIAGASVALIPLYLPSSDTTYYLQLLFGVSAVLVALVGQPELAGVTRMRGMIDGVDRKIRERFGRVTLDSADDGRRVALALAVDESTDVEVVRNGGSERVLLTVDDLSVRFGGLIAVNGVSLRAEMGCITGLIGPNGAGKTTVINACSGAVTAETGALKLNGIDMAGMSPDRRARMGLGRTFQRMQLCEALSVWENVALGSEGRLAGVSVLRQMLQRRGDPALIRARVRSALDACGLTDLADAQVGTLPNGQRRLVEIARCLAGTFDLLLLDEPSSGLDDVETRRVGELLCRVVAEGNVGVLLVEHDMSLVMSVCQTIYVMDFGKLLFCGNPEQTRRDGRVQAAYLGADPTPIEVGP